jgi:hypothetical protein
MGSYHYTVMGYGLLLPDADNSGYDWDAEPPDYVDDEMVGDSVMGEDQGVFFIYLSANPVVALNSEIELTEWITEYTEYTIDAVPPEIDAWYKEFQEKYAGCKFGVFRISSYG